jgi:hypothetical protein
MLIVNNVCRSGASTPYSEATSPRSRAASPGPSNRPASSWKTVCSEHTLSSAIEKLKQTHDCVGSLDILDARASIACAAVCVSSSEAATHAVSDKCTQANVVEDKLAHESSRSADSTTDDGASRRERFLADPHHHVLNIGQIIDGLHGTNEGDAVSPFDTYHAAVRVTSHPTMCGVAVHDAFDKFD